MSQSFSWPVLPSRCDDWLRRHGLELSEKNVHNLDSGVAGVMIRAAGSDGTLSVRSFP